MSYIDDSLIEVERVVHRGRISWWSVFWLVFLGLLTLVIAVKYLGFIMRADNRGEGGILALLALAVPRGSATTLGASALVLLGLFGTALLYGDGVITPAISVLSAVEGLEVATPVFRPVVIPLTIGILVALFVAQRRGTAGIGAAATGAAAPRPC